MSSTIAAVWNCTTARKWGQSTLDDRLKAFAQAVFMAGVEADMETSDFEAAIGCVFVSPEYTFAAADANNKHPAEHITTEQLVKVHSAVKSSSESYPSVLVVPGSTPVKGVNKKATNTAFAYHGGKLLCQFGKKSGVGEVDKDLDLTFDPGVGYGTFDCVGNTYGVQICKDATGAVKLPNTVGVQIVVGQGVGNVFDVKAQGGDEKHAIQNQYSKCQIVADPGAYGVFDTKGRKLLSYKKETAAGTTIYYYQPPVDLTKA